MFLTMFTAGRGGACPVSRGRQISDLRSAWSPTASARPAATTRYDCLKNEKCSLVCKRARECRILWGEESTKSELLELESRVVVGHQM